jgi:hypothetical protein
MRMLHLAVAFVAIGLVAPVQASTTVASPILGLWKLDLASVPTEARPAGVTAEFISAGTEEWNTTYVITTKDGSVRRMTSRERLDGQAVPIEGDRTEADSVAMSSPAPGVLVMALAKDGRPASVRVYSVSKDGTAMTESAAIVGGDGKPVVRTFRWVR